jgi:hypothetical protein
MTRDVSTPENREFWRRIDETASKVEAPPETPTPSLPQLVREFVNYWTGDNEDRRRRVGDSGGCGMCGGLPHSATCFVGRMDTLLNQVQPTDIRLRGSTSYSLLTPRMDRDDGDG